MSRPMKFPYTLSAKIAQFPFKHYFTHNWVWRYSIPAVAITTVVFYKIHRLSNSPENVKKWREMREKEAQEHAHH